MILCNEETQGLLKAYGSNIAKFVAAYEWISDAYVSDFFFKDHWKKLPDSWQTSLASVSTLELSGLLDKGEIRSRQVLPLSLMSFAACTKAYSADRRCPPDFAAAFKTIFHDPNNGALSQLNASQAVAGSEQDDHTASSSSIDESSSREDGSLGRDGTVLHDSNHSEDCRPVCQDQSTAVQNIEDGEGNLHAFFRKHVKPKKQHEIQNLSKVIHLLGEHTGCVSVVDVGAGLGHLSRLLSFGYGLDVTSVEAAGSHAPKANKYDREIDRELKKKQKKKQLVSGEREFEDTKSCLPCHVTSMIYPDTTLMDFLAIVNSQRQTDLAASSTNCEPNNSEHLHGKDSGVSEKSVSDIVDVTRTKMQIGLSDTSVASELPTEVPDNPVSMNTDLAENQMKIKVDERKSVTPVIPSTGTKEIVGDNLKRHQATDNCDIQCKCAKQTNKGENSNLPAYTQTTTKLIAYGSSHCKGKDANSKTDSNCNCENIFNDKQAAENTGSSIKESAIPDSVTSFNDKCQGKLSQAGIKQKEQDDTKSSENDSQVSLDCAKKEVFKETGSLDCAKKEVFKETGSLDCAKKEVFEETGSLDCAKKEVFKETGSLDCAKKEVFKETGPLDCAKKEVFKETGSLDCAKKEVFKETGSLDCAKKEVFKETGFILTGLHACGDLTPTFLRFFVNCEAAKGLASVGCCYMKITDESTSTKVAGYPMSEAIRCLPDHRLTYNARELACHFADTYSQRLKDCPVHLKIHSYRAALEWLINQLCPDIKRTSVQIPAKKADQMDFKRYATVGLQKLGIPTDQLTEELLAMATALTERWRDTVAFYTLRLAMAPVVETLILLDRMFYLYENGYISALMPIFDSKLSPRNFVLLSWKHNT